MAISLSTPATWLISPALETAMTEAGSLLTQLATMSSPDLGESDGARRQIYEVPVDLIVPEAANNGGGRRGARLGVHGNRAARRAVGLEAALFDNTTIAISALEESDSRSVVGAVAGPAALLVAKLHKLHDRVDRGTQERLNDKDAADVIRLMQATSPVQVGTNLASSPPPAGGPGHLVRPRLPGRVVRSSRPTWDPDGRQGFAPCPARREGASPIRRLHGRTPPNRGRRLGLTA